MKQILILELYPIAFLLGVLTGLLTEWAKAKKLKET